MKTLLAAAALAALLVWVGGSGTGGTTVPYPGAPQPPSRYEFQRAGFGAVVSREAIGGAVDLQQTGGTTQTQGAWAPAAVEPAAGAQAVPAEVEGARVDEGQPEQPAAVIDTVVPGLAPWASAPARTGAAPPPVPAGLAAIAVDEASGTVLYDQYGHVPLPPASLTKILTAIVALENADIDSWAQSDIESAEMVGSSVMGVHRGEWFTVRDLLYGLMLPSGNDAAVVLGRKVAGSDAAFVDMMNQFVANLGLKESSYRNAHGLTASDHVSSAYDLAMLSRYAMQNPQFAEIVRTPTWTTSGSRAFTMGNVNSFLYTYPGADGIKTGFTWAAGPTLVASAVRDGKRVYVVVLNSQQKDLDAQSIFDWVFANYTWPSEG